MTDKSKTVLADVLKNKDETISKAELDVIKAKAEQADELASQMEDLRKSLEDLQKAKEEADKALADIEKAKQKKELEETVDVVKGFNLFDEKNVEDVAKFFVQNKGEVSNVILTTLEKARTAIQEFGEKEHGADLEGDELDTEKALGDAVANILKNRKSK